MLLHNGYWLVFTVALTLSICYKGLKYMFENEECVDDEEVNYE